jgi:hypothetical protein
LNGKIDENEKKDGIEGDSYDGKGSKKNFDSYAEMYEAKNDFFLTRRFPYLSRVGIRLRMIISEIGIMTLIIC